jgi:hypothetical protein
MEVVKSGNLETCHESKRQAGLASWKPEIFFEEFLETWKLGYNQQLQGLRDFCLFSK